MSPPVAPARVAVPRLGQVVFSASGIAGRVRQLAEQIDVDYAGQRLIVAAVLKGGAVFAADLVRQLARPAELDFVALSRYGDAEGGKVELVRDLQADVRDCHVLVVEDLVDTGFTLHYVVQQLGRRQPASIRICALLDRPALRLARIPVGYIGFDIGDEFVVGYGLDYRERFRELPDITVLEF